MDADMRGSQQLHCYKWGHRWDDHNFGSAAAPEYVPEADLDQAVGTESSWPEQLLVIDFSTNDSVLRTGLDAASQARSPLVAATEVMLRWLLFERPRVALLLLESDCVSPAHGLYIGTHEAHQRVARHYGVPFLSFASGFRQNVTCSRSPPVWTRTLRGHHPGYQSHQHVADLLAVWLPRLFEMAAGRVATIGHGKQRFSQTRGWGNLSAMPQAITSAELRAQSEICTQPVTTHAAKDARHPSHGPWEGVHVLAGTWAIDRMRADKPGWQTDEDKASLAFDLKFGAKPRITIVYEQGPARCPRSSAEPTSRCFPSRVRSS
jgi:hypothetical protein